MQSLEFDWVWFKICHMQLVIDLNFFFYKHLRAYLTIKTTRKAYQSGLFAVSTYLALYGMPFSSRVSNTRCEKGPAIISHYITQIAGTNSFISKRSNFSELGIKQVSKLRVSKKKAPALCSTVQAKWPPMKQKHPFSKRIKVLYKFNILQPDGMLFSLAPHQQNAPRN